MAGFFAFDTTSTSTSTIVTFIFTTAVDVVVVGDRFFSFYYFFSSSFFYFNFVFVSLLSLGLSRDHSNLLISTSPALLQRLPHFAVLLDFRFGFGFSFDFGMVLRPLQSLVEVFVSPQVQHTVFSAHLRHYLLHLLAHHPHHLLDILTFP